MRLPLFPFFVLAALAVPPPGAEPKVHVWEKHEIALNARNTYKNPYTEVEVWADLKGPGFEKRVYGFWDGENVFRIRLLGAAPGRWTWRTGSRPFDPGLAEKEGGFLAVAWSEEEKAQNPCRRGFLRPARNGHALQFADGTPFFLLGDTWWSTPTFRYRWYDDETRRPPGPQMGFKDMVRFRKEQGFNSIAMIAAFPAWANDGRPATIRLDDAEKTGVRSAWPQPGTQSAKDMHNEGGRPFLFPGRVPGYEDVFPDVDRINPAYFRRLDRKIDYLNAHGFIPFIEAARRDASQAWKKFYDWPVSYARYIQYVWSRYQANNCLFSPVHFDSPSLSIPSREYNVPANLVIERYGPPPFGTLVSTNAAGSTLENFGGPEEAKWLTFHQIGNHREHVNYRLLTEIFHAHPARPALNGEPYYPGWNWFIKRPGSPLPGSEVDDLWARSGMYGSVLSGGLAGHIYGAQGIWGGDIEAAAPVKMWEALLFRSAAEMRHLRTFVMSQGSRYQDLVPRAELVSPNQSGDPKGYTGWAYCARTEDRSFFLLYFEKGCPTASLSGASPGRKYVARWFDPRTGHWGEPLRLVAGRDGTILLPSFPSDDDWALSLLEERPKVPGAPMMGLM